jgi:hypothetical protein
MADSQFALIQRRLARAPSPLNQQSDEPCNCPACVEDAQHLVRPFYLQLKEA